MMNYKKNDKNNSIFQKIVSLEENQRKIIKQAELKKNNQKLLLTSYIHHLKKLSKRT